LIARRADKPNDASKIEVIRSESPEKSSSQSIAQSKWIAHVQKDFFLPGLGLTDATLEKIRGKSFPLGEVATAY